TPALDDPGPVPTETPRRIRAEIIIVFALSLGEAAVWAIIELIERYQAEAPIGQQTASVNPSRSEIEYIDLIRQVLAIGFRLVPVLLALYLLSLYGHSWARRLGLAGNGRRWGKDLAMGAGLAALIGLPGVGLYAIGRAMDLTVRVDTSGLPDQWWAATILLMSAASWGILEEVLVVGYLVTRLRDLKWSVPAILITSALLRGTYHLYQGWPMALGNVVMGLVFAWAYHRTGRLLPMIAAHSLIDVVAFVGPEVAPQSVLDWLNV
ncbi:CPBP family intramembrane glutamic endopeptidase, partial [Demequina sp.]|uniref:CPBP family intramembrane glutamic endopeptidase n=1 Tax=Demequina sp. TaxID=2050685 RepID=UPI00344B4C9C